MNSPQDGEELAMQDVTIHLRGGQSITIRVEKFTWRRDNIHGGLTSMDMVWPDPVDEAHQLNWVRMEAVDAIETRPVTDRTTNGDNQ